MERRGSSIARRAGRRLAGLLALGALVLVPGMAAAHYLRAPEGIPLGTPDDRLAALDSHRAYVDGTRLWLDPRIAAHEARCAGVDTQDAALLADCQTAYAELSAQIDGYFAGLRRYQAEIANLNDWLAIVTRAPSLPPEIDRQLTLYQFERVFSLLLRARLEQRGEDNAQATAEELLRLYNEVTPAWARDGAATPDPERDAQVTRHQLLETYTLLLNHRLDLRGDGSAGAMNEEADRILEQISPAWYMARDHAASAALDPAPAATSPPGVDPDVFLAACGGSALACLQRWPEAESRTEYLLEALHFANVYAAERGTPEDEKWWLSRDYLESWLALNPDDQPAREALAYLEGLHAGATGGP